jgi:hypothetical protein
MLATSSAYFTKTTQVINVTLLADEASPTMRGFASAAGWDQISPVILTVTVPDGIKITATGTGTAALRTGDFIEGSKVKLILDGKVQGAGGKGNNSNSGAAGGVGGDAIEATFPMTIDGDGEIWSGGGGGGSRSGSNGYRHHGAGGGGAGQIVGARGTGITRVDGDGWGGSYHGVAGTEFAGGAGAPNSNGMGNGGGTVAGGKGGNPGDNGVSPGGTGSVAGLAGKSIEGFSLVTITGSPDVQGPTAG